MHVTAIGEIQAAVRRRRIDMGLSQAEAAERAGVSRDWVNTFERGKRTVEVTHVLRLLSALGFGIDLREPRLPETQSLPVGTDAMSLLGAIIEAHSGR